MCVWYKKRKEKPVYSFFWGRGGGQETNQTGGNTPKKEKNRTPKLEKKIIPLKERERKFFSPGDGYCFTNELGQTKEKVDEVFLPSPPLCLLTKGGGFFWLIGRKKKGQGEENPVFTYIHTL